MNKAKCPIHNIELACYCPACLGAASSGRKTRSCKEKGRISGRQRKSRGRNKETTETLSGQN